MVVVLASGGMDSAVLLAMAQRKEILLRVIARWYAQPAALQEGKHCRSRSSFYTLLLPVYEVPLINAARIRDAGRTGRGWALVWYLREI